MVSLLSEKEVSGVTVLFHDLCRNMPDDYFEQMIASGDANSTIVCFDGKPVYRLIWQRIKRGAELSILLAQELSPASNICWLGCAIDKLAESLKVKSAVLTTARRALIKQCQNWGAEVFAVRMAKHYA